MKKYSLLFIFSLLTIVLISYQSGNAATIPTSTPFVISTADLARWQSMIDALKAGQSVSVATRAPTTTLTPIPATSTAILTPTPTLTLFPTFTATPPTTVTATQTPAIVNAFFVSLTGSDSNPGTIDSPWRTFKRAATTVGPGSTVFIRGGVYTENLVPVNSGTANAFVTFSGYPLETVTIDGNGVSLSSEYIGDGLIRIVGKQYVRVQNMTLINSTKNCVNVSETLSGDPSTYIELSGLSINNCYQRGIYVRHSNHITVSGNTINHITISSGIGVWWSDDTRVDHNTITNAHWYHECQGAYDETLSMSYDNRFEVSYNTLDNTEANPTGFCTTYSDKLGIDVKESSQNGIVHHNTVRHMSAAGIYTDGWLAGSSGTPTLNHIDIYQNILTETGGILVGCEQSAGIVEYIRIYNNLVINSYFIGINVTGAHGDGLRKNIQIYNNTVYGASAIGGNGGAGIYVTSAHLASNNGDKPVIIRDNISAFYFTTGSYLGTVGQIQAGSSAIAANVTADHNIVYGPMLCSQAFQNCIEVGTRQGSTPSNLFVNAGALDLHLKAGSVAIGTGAIYNNLGIDYDSIMRLSVDIGAYTIR